MPCGQRTFFVLLFVKNTTIFGPAVVFKHMNLGAADTFYNLYPVT